MSLKVSNQFSIQSIRAKFGFDILFFQATNFAYTICLYIGLPRLIQQPEIKQVLSNIFTGEAFAPLAILPFMVSPNRLANLIDRQGRTAYRKICEYKLAATVLISILQICTISRITPPQLVMILLANLGTALIPHWELTRKGYSLYSTVLFATRIATIAAFLATRSMVVILVGHGLAFFLSGLTSFIHRYPGKRTEEPFSVKVIFHELGPHTYVNGVRTLSLALATHILNKSLPIETIFSIARIERLGRPLVTLSTPYFLRLQTKTYASSKTHGHAAVFAILTVAIFVVSLLGKLGFMPIVWSLGILIDFFLIYRYLPLNSPLPEGVNYLRFWVPLALLAVGIVLAKSPSPYWPAAFSALLLAVLGHLNSKPNPRPT